MRALSILVALVAGLAPPQEGEGRRAAPQAPESRVETRARASFRVNEGPIEKARREKISSYLEVVEGVLQVGVSEDGTALDVEFDPSRVEESTILDRLRGLEKGASMLGTVEYRVEDRHYSVSASLDKLTYLPDETAYLTVVCQPRGKARIQAAVIHWEPGWKKWEVGEPREVDGKELEDASKRSELRIEIPGPTREFVEIARRELERLGAGLPGHRIRLTARYVREDPEAQVGQLPLFVPLRIVKVLPETPDDPP